MEIDSMAVDIVEHLPFLLHTALELEADNILELGVRTGNSTRAFLKACSVMNSKLISIDNEDCSGVAKSPHWIFMQMDDLDYTPPILFDIIFIDTSHLYEHTIKELNHFHKYLTPKKGIIMLHDTVSCPGVMQAIQEFLKSHSQYDFHNHTNNNGLGVIWQREQV